MFTNQIFYVHNFDFHELVKRIMIVEKIDDDKLRNEKDIEKTIEPFSSTVSPSKSEIIN